MRLADDSHVSVRVSEESAWPEIEFDLGIEAFDEAAWQELVGGTLPFHYLICEMPGATMFYQGGGLIPSPEVDPFLMPPRLPTNSLATAGPQTRNRPIEKRHAGKGAMLAETLPPVDASGAGESFRP